MIIKIKTFSGETLYLPEEDYLNEVMFSDEELSSEENTSDSSAGKNYSKWIKGAGILGGTIIGADAGTYIGHKLAQRNNAKYGKEWLKDIGKHSKEDFDEFLNKVGDKYNKYHNIGRATGALAGAGLTAAGIYGYKKYKQRKNNKNEQNS